VKAAPTVEVMPNLPDENSPEFKQHRKKHKKYVDRALKSQAKDPRPDMERPRYT
jgi:hypothetical protein